ncbi:HmuY family protein [Tenacibaculum sp. SDUM215027]|uniref:HmuY family protein n=1 Tax=Tenacibaculum sp. SDUM215027 TaxID=3422596 RepID=UPI003D311D2D
MKNKILSFMLLATICSFVSCDSDNDLPSDPIKVVIEGATVAPEVGGPNQPNQVYVDLSTSTTTKIKRDSWDLGFYSGDKFRVVINGSVYMAAAQLSSTDIDAVNSSDQEVKDLQPKVAIGTFDATSSAYIDAPSGDLNTTAIAEVSDTEANNKVYLINLGDEIGTENPATGSVDISDDSRGWKKVRILKDGDAYVLQYADLDATTHSEAVITKAKDNNFSFFSFDTEKIVSVEPAKTEWDLNFTVFTNEIEGYGAYGYSDFVINNIKSNVKVYMINTETEDFTYEAFVLADVSTELFSNDQRGIGSSWRNGGGPGSLPSLKENVFYVLEDTDGNIYKIKFLAMTNDAGERGYPEFVYSLLK